MTGVGAEGIGGDSSCKVPQVKRKILSCGFGDSVSAHHSSNYTFKETKHFWMVVPSGGGVDLEIQFYFTFFIDGRVAGHLGAAVGLKTLSIHVAVHTLEYNLPPPSPSPTPHQHPHPYQHPHQQHPPPPPNNTPPTPQGQFPLPRPSGFPPLNFLFWKPDRDVTHHQSLPRRCPFRFTASSCLAQKAPPLNFMDLM